MIKELYWLNFESAFMCIICLYKTLITQLYSSKIHIAKTQQICARNQTNKKKNTHLS